MHAHRSVVVFRYLFVPKDLKEFFSWAVSWANVYIWSSAKVERVESVVHKGFAGIFVNFSGWAGQQLCDVGTFCMGGGKPVFFKCLQNFLAVVQRYDVANVLLVDNSMYKCHFNPPGSYIIVPGMEHRSSDYFSKDLKDFLTSWRDATDRPACALSFKNADSTRDDKYVATALERGAKKTSYERYRKGPKLKPMLFRY